MGTPAAIHFLTWLTIPCNLALVAESRLFKVRIAKRKKERKKQRTTTHL